MTTSTNKKFGTFLLAIGFILIIFNALDYMSGFIITGMTRSPAGLAILGIALAAIGAVIASTKEPVLRTITKKTSRRAPIRRRR
jgi:hypothetical protein